METNSATLKRSILDALRREVDARQFNTWFNKFDFIPAGENVVHVPVPNPFYQELAEREFRKPIEDAFRRVFGAAPEIIFQVVASLNEELWPPNPTTAARPAMEAAPPADAGPSEDRSLVRQVEGYSFESFVVGPSNRLAYAAAMAVSQDPARQYNPLFIHGSVGLGKTHLLRAICAALLHNNPAIKIIYLPCENFVNDFISAVQKGGLDGFRNRYRSADVLLVDDVHFLANKEGSQEEFFHTFNALHGARKQIILSSDSPPKDIPTLKERLVSRFAWGFVAQIDAPTFEMRVAILKKKAEMMNRDIPMEVLTHIAENIRNNIRELESAITRLTGFSSITNRAIDMKLAQEILKDLIASSPHEHPITIPEIQQAVCRYYGIKITDLQSRRWTKSLSLPRQICICLARQFTHHSLKEIGAFFGGKDHATVMYAIRKVERLVVKDSRVRGDLENLRREIRDR